MNNPKNQTTDSEYSFIFNWSETKKEIISVFFFIATLNALFTIILVLHTMIKMKELGENASHAFISAPFIIVASLPMLWFLFYILLRLSLIILGNSTLKILEKYHDCFYDKDNQNKQVKAE